MSIVTYSNIDTPIFDIYYPRYLFASGEDGSLLPDLSAPVDSLFQDSAGTIPVTAYGDFVGLAEDQSLNGRDWVQATNAARMRYGRMPRSGVRNLLPYSSDFATWGKLGAPVITPNAAISPIGELTASKLSVGVGSTTARVYTNANNQSEVFSVYARAGEYSGVCVHRNNVTATWLYVVFNLQTGEKVFGGTSVQIDNVGSGWWRISLPISASSQSLQVTVADVNAATAEEAMSGLPSGDGTSGIYIWGGQLEKGDSVTPYQHVTGQWDITEEGIPDQPILYADLADDAMDIELPAITGGTIVLAGEKGIWIDEFDFAGGTFSYGPTTYTGGPDQLIQNLVGERLIGGFVIGRALTAAERAQNIQYYRSRGAPGVWELGPELLTDPEFENPAAWDSAGESMSGGQATITSSSSLIEDNITNFSAQHYLQSVDIESKTGVTLYAAPSRGPGYANGALTVTSSEPGVFRGVSRMTGNVNAGTYALSGTTNVAVLNRVSLKELILNTEGAE